MDTGTNTSGGALSHGPVELAPLGSVLRPVRAGNGFEEALEQILQVIRLGLVSPGERLPAERELAERLRISRVTLREVLKVLQEQGLVESRRGRYGGTFVRARRATRVAAEELRCRMAGVDLADTLRFREVLDVGSAGLCATHDLGPDQRRRLRAALDGTRDAAPQDYRRADTLFHLTLAALADSPSLATAYAAVRARLNDLLDCLPLLVRSLEHSQAQHAALTEAVLDGDADGAREVMREHCAGTAALVRGFLT
ncbi:FadR/GntR family transcriptional regulator [Streptomyces sp. NPDC057702]|uniref:FadR/GntR family transcriptional regulator n=1 Tax=unclassified Streptomyces TaxID=2593676 RepID=UPI0036CA5802